MLVREWHEFEVFVDLIGTRMQRVQEKVLYEIN